jgi:hypothetical protein
VAPVGLSASSCQTDRRAARPVAPTGGHVISLLANTPTRETRLETTAQAPAAPRRPGEEFEFLARVECDGKRHSEGAATAILAHFLHPGQPSWCGKTAERRFSLGHRISWAIDARCLFSVPPAIRSTSHGPKRWSMWRRRQAGASSVVVGLTEIKFGAGRAVR